MWQVEEDHARLGGPEGIKDKLRELKDSGLYIYDHKGVIDMESVYRILSYMVKGLDCEYVILDNLSISVAGAKEAEKKKIDEFIYKLVGLINNTGATVLNVVHLVKNRKDKDGQDAETVSRADIYGSGSLAKFSHAVVALERESDKDRVKLKILANRDTGVEGYTDTLLYNHNTGRLSPCKDQDVL
jgi:hypothetical protein